MLSRLFSRRLRVGRSAYGWCTRVRGLVGYGIDLTRIARIEFVNPHSYTKFRIIRKISRETGARIFVETGTYRGVTARRCSDLFESVITIEIVPELADAAKRRLAHVGNVEVICGDAVEVLPAVLSRREMREVLVFLDSHFSGPGTGMGKSPEPALALLTTVAEHSDKVRAVVIDDFRCFGVESGTPSKSELLRHVETALTPVGFDIRLILDQLVLVKKPIVRTVR